MNRGRLLHTAVITAAVLGVGLFDLADSGAAQAQTQYPYLSGSGPAAPRALIQDLTSGTYQYMYIGNGAQNIVTNGDFLIDQQRAGAAVTLTSSGTVGYRAPDRWINWFYVSGGSAGNPTAQQVAASTGAPSYVQDELKITASSTAAAPPTGSYGFTEQSIEGEDMEDLAWGATAGGSHVGVSVWLKASVAGTYDVAIQNSGAALSWVHDCVVGTAATWTNCNFTVTPPTSGTWNRTYGTIGANVYITNTCGATYQGVASKNDTWQTGAFYCSPNQTQLTNNASATLEIAAVTVMKGRQPVQFVAEPMVTTLAKARRFYQMTFPLGTAPAQSAGVAGAVCGRTSSTTAGTFSQYLRFVPLMYAAPTTVTTYNPSATNAKWRDVTGSSDVTQQVDVSTAVGATGIEIGTTTDALTAAHDLCIHVTADTLL